VLWVPGITASQFGDTPGQTIWHLVAPLRFKSPRGAFEAGFSEPYATPH
jgi:hypothetical protein